MVVLVHSNALEHVVPLARRAKPSRKHRIKSFIFCSSKQTSKEIYNFELCCPHMPPLPVSRFKYSPLDSFRNYLPKQSTLLAKDGCYQFRLWLKFCGQLCIIILVIMLPILICNYIYLERRNIYYDDGITFINQSSRVLQWSLYASFWFHIQLYNYIYSFIPQIDHNMPKINLSQSTTPQLQSPSAHKPTVSSYMDIDDTSNYANYYPKKRIFQTLRVLFFIINVVIICVLLYYEYFASPAAIRRRTAWNSDAQIGDTNNPVCNFFRCGRFWDLYNVWRHVIGLPVTIIGALLVNHCIFLIYIRKCSSHIRSKPSSSIQILNDQHKSEMELKPINSIIAVDSASVTSSMSLMSPVRVLPRLDDDGANINTNNSDVPFLTLVSPLSKQSSTGSSSSDISVASSELSLSISPENDENTSSETIDDTGMVKSNLHIGKYNITHDTVYEQSPWDITMKFLICGVLYMIILSIALCTMYGALLVQADKEYSFIVGTISTYTFVSLLYRSLMTVYKFVANRLARRIDVLRMQIPRNHYPNQTVVKRNLTQSHVSVDDRKNESINININSNNNKKNSRHDALWNYEFPSLIHGIGNFDYDDHDETGLNKNELEQRFVFTNHLSFEIISNWFMELLYWMIYRMLIIYNVNDGLGFALLKIPRLIALVWCVVIRAHSQWYWKFSNGAINDYLLPLFRGFASKNNKYKCNCIGKCLLQFVDSFNSHSTMKMWQQRLAIELMGDFFIAFFSCVIVSILVEMGGENYVVYDDKIKAIRNMTISALLEIIYFIFTIIYYHYSIKMQFVEPFLRFYTFNGFKFVFYFALLFAISANFIPLKVLLQPDT